MSEKEKFSGMPAPGEFHIRPEPSMREASQNDQTRLPSRSYSWLVRALVYAHCLRAFAIFDTDNDLWGHIKFGELIWTTRSIPATDPYSHTAQGLPWINHEWLSEVFFYLLFRFFDSTGLLVLKLLVGLFVVHTLSRLYFAREKNLLAYVAVFFLLPYVLDWGFMARPQLLTWFFLVCLIDLLNRFFGGDRKKMLWAPLVMLLWANAHGGVVAGIGIFGVVVFCELVRCRFQGGGEGIELLKYFVPSGLATFINPYGHKLWFFFLETIPVKRDITEWNAIPLFDAQFLHFKIMVILLAVTLLIVRTKRHFWEPAINLIAVYFGFRHQRHTVLAGILMIPLLPQQLARSLRLLPLERFRPSRALHFAFQAGLAILILVQCFLVFSLARANHFKIQVNPGFYPVYAVRFMKLNGINGNILNPFNWGEYLIWHLPESKVSTDGRLETIFPKKVFLENLDYERKGGWREMLRRYPAIDIILSNKTDPEIDGLPDWVKIYEDPIAAIFIRKMDPPSRILEKFYKKELADSSQTPSWEFP